MSSLYYIDESGTSGDLARTGPGLGFGDQPVFSLACIGLDDEAAAIEAIEALKRRHKVALTELKASRLYTRPAFILDLVGLLAEWRAPVMVEVTEKRFAVAIHIVNHQVMTGGHHLGDPTGEALARALAEFIGQAAPDAVFRAFVEACSEPSSPSVIRSLTTLRDWGRAFRPAFQLSEFVARLSELALSELEPDAQADDPYSFRRFLPDPHDGPTGKPMWMLPGLSSFTNLCARLNLLHGRRLAGVTLVHDDQRYMEGALRDAMASMQIHRAKLSRIGARFADYDLMEPAKLVFHSSDDIGLQIADVIAGSFARHMKTVLLDPNAERPLQGVVDRLIEFADARRGLGVNFVATDRLLAAARIPTV